MASDSFELRFILTNKAAVDAFGDAIMLIRELREDFPYREEPKQALKKLKYALAHLKPRLRREAP